MRIWRRRRTSSWRGHLWRMRRTGSWGCFAVAADPREFGGERAEIHRARDGGLYGSRGWRGAAGGGGGRGDRALRRRVSRGCSSCVQPGGFVDETGSTGGTGPGAGDQRGSWWRRWCGTLRVKSAAGRGRGFIWRCPMWRRRGNRFLRGCAGGKRGGATQRGSGAGYPGGGGQCRTGSWWRASCMIWGIRRTWSRAGDSAWRRYVRRLRHDFHRSSDAGVDGCEMTRGAAPEGMIWITALTAEAMPDDAAKCLEAG